VTSAPFDLAETDRLLTTTRAVRRRLDLERPVPRQVLLDCIRIAQQAPTGGNAQNWHFVVVTEASRRAQLAEVYRDQGLAMLTRARDGAEDEQTRRVYGSAVYLAENLQRVPVHVLPCIRAGVPDDAVPPTQLAGLYANILPATWSFMLALRSRGLGSAWTTQTVGRPEVAELLGLPADVLHVGLVPVAYHTGRDFRPATRPAPDTITHWNGWRTS
jgi:nitroreductase